MKKKTIYLLSEIIRVILTSMLFIAFWFLVGIKEMITSEWGIVRWENCWCFDEEHKPISTGNIKW